MLLRSGLGPEVLDARREAAVDERRELRRELASDERRERTFSWNSSASRKIERSNWETAVQTGQRMHFFT